MSQKTTNLKLNINYTQDEQNYAWLNGMDQNYVIIDNEIGNLLIATHNANLRLDNVVELTSISSSPSSILTPSKDMGSCVIDKYVYIMGGSQTPKSIYRYNTSNNSMTLIDLQLPVNCYYCKCESIGNKIYAFSDDNIILIDLDENTVELLEVELPINLSFYSSFIIDNIIYLAGGKDTNNVEYSCILRFNPASMTVTNLGDLLPNDLYYSSAIAVNKKGYIIGGKNTNKILRFDPTQGTVTELNVHLPNACYGTSLVSNNDNIYIFGGYNDSTCYNYIYKLNTTNLNLTELEITLPKNLAFATSQFAIANGYIFGGWNTNGLNSDIFKFIE